MSAELRCPKCSCPLDSVRLPEGVTVESCPHCFGAFYDLSELALAVELTGAVDTQWACPKCAKPLRTGRAAIAARHAGKEESPAGRAFGAIDLDQCTACSGLWFDAGEVAKLRKLSGVEGIVRPEGAPVPAEPRVGAAEPPIMPAAALAAFSEKLEAQRRRTQEAAQAKGPSAPDAKASPFPEIPDSSSLPNPDERKAPVARFEDREYGHFQTSAPVVTYVVGEFPWKVKVGEKSRARDFVRPPYLLSQEVTGKESVWTHGRYHEPEEIWSAFKLPGAPPPRVGVAPAQPNPYEEAWARTSRAFWGLSIAAVGLAVLIALQAAGTTVFEKSFSYDPKAVEKSLVTEPFDLGGHTANVEAAVSASLNNQWAYFSMALINTETDHALDFGREVAFYSGVDEDGQWREGSPTDTVYLPRVPPGRYYLRIEPETDTGAFNYTIRLRRDVARMSFAIVALILLALPMLWLWWRRHVFEQQRWVESDHPWASSDEDDE